VNDDYCTSSAAATEACGASLAGQLAPGDVVLLTGELAAGKTTLVRGIVRGLGGDPEQTSSPTFVILQSYPCQCRGITVVHHLDLYRLDNKPEVLREVGVEEILSEPSSVTVVEWPRQILEEWIPPGGTVWRLTMTHGSGDRRLITVRREKSS